MDKDALNGRDEMNNLLSANNDHHHNKPRFEKDDWHSPSDDRGPPSCFESFLEAELRDVTSLSFWQACVAEFVGVFLLCFYTITVGLAFEGDPNPSLLQIALGVGFFITAIVSTLANVSGAHVNPAVTLGFSVLRHISLARTAAYIIFQCAGAVTGSMVLKGVLHDDMVGGLGVIIPPAKSTAAQAITMEFMIAFFLVFVVVGALDKGRTDVGGSIPLLVGVTVSTNILFAGQVSGGCMNPARALGPAVAMGNYNSLWIFWLGPCAGGMAGALLYDKLFSVSASPRRLFHRCCRSTDQEYMDALSRGDKRLAMELEASPESKI